ncbi:hypothetical protein BC629DRAFT_1582504 [Irpex lacteus]|nr:hypothetical protein BC629DRAFT_1582504 [Irpex lacteus]
MSSRVAECPPCFNCQLEQYSCGHFGECSRYDGQCKCPPGWAGMDCLTPQCDSLADGEKRRQREDGKKCECKDGWGGVNCNVCKTDAACRNFPLRDLPDDFLDDDSEGVGNMTCYKGGETVFQNHQICDVTNRKILDMLPDRPPEVTFSCDNDDRTCQFQFWTAQVESFYCSLDTCTSSVDIGHDKNVTKYDCEHIQCKCVPGRFICGENGSIDISDFLKDDIKGPASFSCTTGQGCRFEEPGMNDLILTFFGDSYITLECDSGECLHYSQVPGYVKPPKPDTTRFVALSVAGAGLIFLSVSAGLWYASRTRSGDFGGIRLPEAESAKLMTDHVPASLHFSDISYSLGNHIILDKVSGSVKPGQLLAIMGASGAGKSTFLDILARKNKRGQVGGRTLVNGREVPDSDFKKVMGFVDQEDTLMSTLTVYETVLYSALLRLPREMSLEAKKFRTLETLHELGILGIKDSRIGESGRRSISGGEKRRVSIACELVTSPSILFLDEPTSGLDAYNALSVVDSLSIGNPCPPVDTTMLAGMEPRSLDSPSNEDAPLDGEQQRQDEEQAYRPSTASRFSLSLGGRQSSSSEETELQTTTTVIGTSTNYIKRKTPSAAALPDVALENSLTRGRRGELGTQFTILSGRAFKNLYRNPALLAAHYISAIGVALICGMFFYHSGYDIPGMQTDWVSHRRLCVFFFTLALFGFSCLSSLGLFANERILFMRERANGYYSPLTYFAAKVLFDMLPLRVVPPLVFGSIIYGLVGLVPEVATFWKFMLTLILFNLATASVILLLSIAFASVSVASLVGTLIMLFNLLFTGLLVNREPAPGFQWLHDVSFFHAAYEALAVNELKYLQLKQKKYGVELDIPAATILSLFGLRANSFWWPNVALLGIFFGVFTIASYLVLRFYVKEKR